MKYIQTPEFTAIVDSDDYELYSNLKWRISTSGYIYYSAYLGKLGDKYVSRNVYLHRLVSNAPKDKQVDHINGDKLDNRKSNLRFCTNQQNNRNTKSRKGSSSKFKGVSWDSTNKKWMSQISLGGGKHIRIGRFSDEIEAAKAYDAMAKLHHGEFAFLNFPHSTAPYS